MQIYLLTQTTVGGYDTFLKAVVVADNEQEARETHPSGDVYFDYGRRAWLYIDGALYQDVGQVFRDWPDHPEDVTATRIGTAVNYAPHTDAHVICSSFNAG